MKRGELLSDSSPYAASSLFYRLVDGFALLFSRTELVEKVFEFYLSATSFIQKYGAEATHM